MIQQHILLLDLKDDPASIAAYESWHTRVWPGILDSIRRAGIHEMKIFRAGNRLVMLLDTDDSFDFEAKGRADADDPLVQEWEKLMDHFQQSLPFSAPGEKWVRMKNIFSLNDLSADV